MYVLTIIDDGKDPKTLEIFDERVALNIQSYLVEKGMMVKRDRLGATTDR
jgi:hypothetical protein